MSTQNITGTNTYTTPIVVPDNGAPVDGAGLAVATQGIANQIEYVKQRVPGIANSWRLGINLSGARSNPDNRWAAEPAGWRQVDVTDGGGLFFAIPELQNYVGCKITSAAIRLFGGTHSGLPANKPGFGLWRYLREDGAPSPFFGVGSPVGGSLTTDVVPLANYQLIHSINKLSGGFPYTITSQEYLVLGVFGESGANSAVGLTLLDAWINLEP